MLNSEDLPVQPDGPTDTTVDNALRQTCETDVRAFNLLPKLLLVLHTFW